MIVSAKNIEHDEMFAALNAVNEQFADNVTFNRYDRLSPNRIQFTLRVNDSSKPGARRAQSDFHKMTAACWHVHGYFFEALFKVRPDAKVRTGRHVITAEAGNWKDFNIGSQMRPMYASEACEC